MSHTYLFNSDEKWFYGLVARTFAKACESLSIRKQSFSCQHKSHITKVMGHGTVGYCFDSDPELGGTGYLIGLHRCQSFKVMQRKVNEQTVDAETGKRKQKGNSLKHNRGDLVLTDCNVTGSNYSKPKFSLMSYGPQYFCLNLTLWLSLVGLVRVRWLIIKKTTPALTSTRYTKLGCRSSLMYVDGSSSIRHHRVPTSMSSICKCSQL